MDLATGALSSLLPKLLELLKEEYKLHKGVKKDLESLSRELKSIEAAVRKVAEVPRDQLDEEVKLWADDVREVSYDMEDVVDSFLLRPEGSDSDSFKGLMKKMSNLFKNGKARHEIADAIKDIKQQVQDVAARRDRYKFDDLVRTTTPDPRLFYPYEKVTDLIGIDEPRDELIKRLAPKENDQMDIVSIVGFGGLGKTVLAKAVYDRVRTQFDCTAFVSISQNPDIKRILKNMLHMLGHEKYDDINEACCDERDLINELRNFLRCKRYLVVIDDIWEVEAWEILRCALVANGNGSRIITTTRNFHISAQIGDPYKLRPLTLESSKTLFYGRIFGSKVTCPEQFSEVSMDILKKCGGVPLALITMASVLAVPGNIENPRNWHKVYDSIGSGLGDDPCLRNMRSILSLSYYNLPLHLKACMLYLGIYPGGYEIPRDDLIWKWIAEGFLQQKNMGGSLFEVGNSYFNELLNRGILQPCIDGKGNATHCHVHSMMLDLIYSLLTEENFVTILDHSKDGISSQKNVRRLSLQNEKEDHQTSPVDSMAVSQVRSITVFRPAIKLMRRLSSFSVLRVLDLSGCNIQECGLLDLRVVGNLLHLRYLGLGGTSICQLPEQIGNLQVLQVLDVRNNFGLKELPSVVFRLRSLVCLYVDRYQIRLPDGLGKLVSIEVLEDIHATLNIVKELHNLATLRKLKINLRNESLELEEAFVESLCNLHNIQSLAISGDGSFRSMDLLAERWVPPRRLGIFESHMLGEFSAVPLWIKRNPSLLLDLSELSIAVKELQQEDLHILGRLPALRYLRIQSAQQTERRLVISADVFDSVIAFSMFCESSSLIMFKQGALPRAEIVEFDLGLLIAKEERVGVLDLGLKNLVSSRKVFVRIFHDGVTVREVKEAKTVIKDKLGALPSHPNVLIDMVPYLPEGGVV